MMETPKKKASKKGKAMLTRPGMDRKAITIIIAVAAVKNNIFFR
jgi:hypothetical protein